jgi:hypothetical protein
MRPLLLRPRKRRRPGAPGIRFGWERRVCRRRPRGDRVGRTGTLPFTGFPLWVVVLVAGTLIPVGLALRRQARATV